MVALIDHVQDLRQDQRTFPGVDWCLIECSGLGTMSMKEIFLLNFDLQFQKSFIFFLFLISQYCGKNNSITQIFDMFMYMYMFKDKLCLYKTSIQYFKLTSCKTLVLSRLWNGLPPPEIDKIPMKTWYKILHRLLGKNSELRPMDKTRVRGPNFMRKGKPCHCH